MARTAEVVYIGRPEDLLAAQAKIRASSEATSGAVGKSSSEIVAAGDAAGKAAAEQARLIGGSLNEQNAAYNHAAREAEKSAAAQQAAAAKAAKAAEEASAKIDGAAKRIATGGLLAIGAAAYGVHHAAETTAELAKETRLLHNVTGLSIQSASTYASVASAQELNVKQLNQSFGTLSKNVQAVENAHDGLTKAAKTQENAFRLLGLPLSSIMRTHGDLNKLLPEITSRFEKMPGGIEKTAVGMALFGRGWQTLMPLMHSGALGLKDQLAEAEKMGATLGGSSVKSLKDFQKAQEDAKYGTLGMELAIGEYLAPALTKLMVFLANTAHSLGDGVHWLEKHEMAAIALAGVLTTVLGAALSVLIYTKAVAFGKAFHDMTTAAGALATRMRVTAGAVTAADGEMAAANEALVSSSAAGSFVSMSATAVASIGKIGVAVGAAVLALQGLESVLEKITGERQSIDELFGNQKHEHGKGSEEAGEKFLKKWRKEGFPSKTTHETLSKGGDVASEIMAFWESQGYSHAAAAGFVGNAAQESSLSPSAPGGGLYQQSGYPSSYGTGSVAQQSQHVLESLSPQLRGMLQRAKSPQEAARLIEIYYEKPAGSQPGETATTNNRAYREQAALEAYRKHPASNAQQQPTGNLGYYEPAGPKAAKVKEYLLPNGEVMFETAAQHAHRALMEHKAKIENAPYVLAGKHLTLTPAQQARVNAELGEASSAYEAAGMNKRYASESGEVWSHLRALQEAKRKPLSTAQGAQEQTMIDETDLLTAKARQTYYEREVKALQKEAKAWGKLRDSYRKFARHAHGHAKVEALNKAAAYDGKVKAAKQEAGALHGTIQDAEAQVDEAQFALNTSLPEEISGAALTGYQASNSKIDLEERAGVLTPEQAKAAKEANANKALSSGALSEEGKLQVQGDLREFQKALESATAATEAHTNAVQADTKATLEREQAARKLAEVENGTLVKAIADMVSGQIGGVAYHGRTITAGAGTAARY